MRNVFFISSLFLLTVQGLNAQGEARFYAETSATEVMVGETFKISFILENGKNSSRFSPPDWAAVGFMLLGSSQSSNFSIQNGQTTASASYHYTLTPTEPGNLTIPALSIKNGDGELYTEPIQIQALPNPDGTAPENPKRTPNPATPAPKRSFKTIRM